MHPIRHSLYACPVCQQALHCSENTLTCAQNHSFDRHKKGYVNLLMSQHKNSKAPGDNIDMVNGRREFLRAGHYQAFADAIVTLANECQASTSEHLSIVDAGCGEGFYTEQIQQAVNSDQVYGFDISKPAITAAAKDKQIDWCVASSNRPPYLDSSFDLVVSVFSRVEREAFLRILKPAGYVLYAGPGNNHLHGLRSIIYDEVNDYSSDKHHDYFAEDFTLVKELSLQVPIKLDSHSSIMQLLSMTHHAHRIAPAGRERLAKTQSLKDMGDFKLYLYQKQ
jgi:23S rRNA (guanine745-N1)-methyltransferase